MHRVRSVTALRELLCVQLGTRAIAGDSERNVEAILDIVQTCLKVDISVMFSYGDMVSWCVHCA